MMTNSVEVFFERCNALMGGQEPWEILQNTYDLLSNEACWTQGARARDQEGVPVQPEDPNAVAWDIEGAVAISCNSFGILPPYFMVVLDQVAMEMRCIGVNEANEAFTHEGVLELLSRAIMRVHSEHGRNE